MKKCPKCNRTYADDGFTFCLEDGALLSAPYDPEKGAPLSTLQSGGPPPTAVLPHPATGTRPSDKVKPQPLLPPTIASPVVTPGPEVATPFTSHLDFSASPRKKSTRLYIAISLLALIIVLGAIYLYVQIGKTNCPRITVQCSQYESTASCYLQNEDSAGNHEQDIGPAISSLHPIMALQAAAAALPKGISKVTWAVSPGRIRYQEGGSAGFDTTGFAGQEVTVKATFTGDSSVCSGTATTTFVVPPSTAPGVK